MGRARVILGWVRSIENQATGHDEIALEVDGWRLVLGRKADDEIAMRSDVLASRHDLSAVRNACEGHDRALDAPGIGR